MPASVSSSHDGCVTLDASQALCKSKSEMYVCASEFYLYSDATVSAREICSQSTPLTPFYCGDPGDCGFARRRKDDKRPIEEVPEKLRSSWQAVVVAGELMFARHESGLTVLRRRVELTSLPVWLGQPQCDKLSQ